MVDRRRILGGGAALVGAAVLGACVGGSDDPDRATIDAVGASRSRIRYGGHDDAFGDLWLPSLAADPDPARAPVVVLVHGGFWRDGFSLDLMDGLAQSVVGAGFAAWNIEYRRLGSRGGWPATFEDVAAAVDHLALIGDGVDGNSPLDLASVSVVGHSAGGHLAMWAASRHRIPAGNPGAHPIVRPVLAVPLAGVLDLVACAEAGIGGSSCADLLGGRPDEVPERYALASPTALLPVGVPVVAVHGSDDRIVPPTQSSAFVEAATMAGDEAELVEVAGADHFDVVDPRHRAWHAVLEHLSATLP